MHPRARRAQHSAASEIFQPDILHKRTSRKLSSVAQTTRLRVERQEQRGRFSGCDCSRSGAGVITTWRRSTGFTSLPVYVCITLSPVLTQRLVLAGARRSDERDVLPGTATTLVLVSSCSHHRVPHALTWRFGGR
eukprot:1357038-Rhodomonas_salina.3